MTLSRTAGAVSALVLLIATLVPANAAEPDDTDALRAADSAPVIVDGVELFRVAGAASLPSTERARSVSERIVRTARNPAVRLEDVTIDQQGDRYHIIARPLHLITVSRGDIELEGASPADIAQVRLQRVREAIERFRAERRPEQMAKAAFKALAATVVAALSLFLLLRLFRWTLAAVERRYRARIQAVSISSFELLGAEKIWSSINGILRLARLLAVIGLLLFYLAYVLYQFPGTRTASGRIFHMVTEPLQSTAIAIVQYVPKLLFLVVLIYLVRALLKLNAAFFDSVRSGTTALPRFDPEWARPTCNLVRIIIILFAAVVAYPYLPGSGSAAFQGISIFAGVLFSLGASSYMANIIAGYTLAYRRAFRVGDFVRIGEQVGEVREVRLLVTHLKTPKNEEVVVPNSLVLQNQILNYSKFAATDRLVLHTQVGIGYDVAWQQVEAILLESADRTHGVLREPAPYVLIRSLDDFAVKYELNVYVDSGLQMLLRYAELHRSILDVFNERGIQIMTPAYEGDPETPKIASTTHRPPAPGVRGITGPVS